MLSGQRPGGRGGTGGMAARPLLDEAYLDRLAAHLGEEAVAELLSDGLIELADRFAEAKRLIAEADGQGLVRLTHDLTGVAGHMGLSALSAAAAEANRALRAPPWAEAEAGVALLLELGAESAVALRRHLGLPDR